MSEENDPATKADVQAVKTELKADVQAVKDEVQSLRSEFKTDIDAVVERLLGAVHDAETRVLNAFYGFAQTNQKRMTLLEGTESNMISRLGTVESRILEIERRLNIPPAA